MLHDDIGIHFDMNTDGLILDESKLNEWRHVIMEVSMDTSQFKLPEANQAKRLSKVRKSMILVSRI